VLRFGGPTFLGTAQAAKAGTNTGEQDVDPHALIKGLKEKGYNAAYAPRVRIGQTAEIREIRRLFEEADILLAEVGYWENLLALEAGERSRNRHRMTEELAVADALGARCCVDILGSYCHGHGTSTHSARNFSHEAFEEAVSIARTCIDAVRPKTAYFTYEIFPLNVVDSPEMIARLLQAVDRKQFGVHMDLVNLINCPRGYFNSAGIIRRCAELFGERIVSAHAKDIKLREPALSVILEEVRPGLGGLDFRAYLRTLNALPQTVPLLMEHLGSEDEYDVAAGFIREVARSEGIQLCGN
jgi:sugar phosphate isomerase/epimerase